MAKTKEIPGNGLKGLRRHWKNDALAAISVALIALPLSLGIALAAGAPAMSGIISAVVGGIVTTLYRGGHVSINGPAKGDRRYWHSTEVGENVSIGSNATILPVRICDRTVIGAGSVVVKDITHPGVYAGNPARFIRNL